MLSISGDIVAEKSSDCRLAGSILPMRLIDGKKPISSMRSASSRTSVVKPRKSITPWSIKSMRRPGVAMIMFAPRLRACICLA